MRRRPVLALAIGGLVWIAAVTIALVEIGDSVNQPPPRLTPLPHLRCPAPLLGVNSTLAYEGEAQQGATVAAIRAVLHPQIVRDSLLWNEIEPVRGQRDWSVPDGIVKDLRAARIEPLLVVVGSPPWANGVPASKPGHELYVPAPGPALDAWLARYSKFLAAAVRRYDVVVKHWEIWNEPNLVDFWRPRPDPVAYRQVYETLRATILRVDPTAQVAVGGLGDLSTAPAPDIPGLSFLRSIERTDSELGNVAIHPYSTDDQPPDVDIAGANNFDDIGRVHDLLVSQRERASIWVTEWGWPTATVGQARAALDVGESLTMLEHRYPFVSVATYFLDHDLPSEHSSGLLDANLKAKPAASVFRFYAERLAAQCH